MTASSTSLPAGESELEQLGLETAPFNGFSLPRLADCRVAYACERYQIQEIGGTPQSLILGRVQSLFVDDAVVAVDAKGRVKVVADKLDPLGRLGANEYVTFGEILHVRRPE